MAKTRRTKKPQKSHSKPVPQTRWQSLVWWFFGILVIICSSLIMVSYAWVGLVWLLVGFLILPVFKMPATLQATRQALGLIFLFISLIWLIIWGSQHNNQDASKKILASLSFLSPSQKTLQPKSTQPIINQPTIAPVLPVFYEQENLPCLVIDIPDGDSIHCLDNQQRSLALDLSQIKAPKISQNYGTIAQKQLSKLIKGQLVIIKIQGQDTGGSYFGEVYLQNLNINKQMVRLGLAWADQEQLQDSDYLSLEQMARTQRLGLWSDNHPIYPKYYQEN